VPELPEIETAVRLLRRVAVGRVIEAVHLLHPSLGRMSPALRRSFHGARVTMAERRGKHQLLHLADGRTIRVHFRMTGDWHADTVDAERPRFARAAIDFADGTRLVLVDPRALSKIDVHGAGAPIDLGLGPEPDDPALTAKSLRRKLANRRGAIKPVLLDQGVIAGLGNIYVAEALWRARIDPRRPAMSLTPSELTRLLAAVRFVIRRASGARYRDRDGRIMRLDVYDREGDPCRRCENRIQRITQAARSSYYCPHCQV
jgi:formamidopyrimidine-DNA glycosylase